MSLINCPECGNEVSTTAAACPHCARPINPPAVAERKVVVMDPGPQSEGFPSWALIPIGLLALILVIVLYIVWGRGSTEDTTNVRVTANSANRPLTQTTVPGQTTAINPVEPSTSTLPPPQTSAPTSQTTVPGTVTTVNEPPPTKGRVNIEAKVLTRSGGTQAVKNERFYLLDQDVESILSSAGVEPLEGQTLSGSLGLAIVYPDQYGDFNRRAMSAIKRHVKYAGQTDGSGKASVSGVEPMSYYLFGITKIGRGFSLWNSPVSIQVGDNVLTLSPQSVTEIAAPNG